MALRILAHLRASAKSRKRSANADTAANARDRIPPTILGERKSDAPKSRVGLVTKSRDRADGGRVHRRRILRVAVRVAETDHIRAVLRVAVRAVADAVDFLGVDAAVGMVDTAAADMAEDEAEDVMAAAEVIAMAAADRTDAMSLAASERVVGRARSVNIRRWVACWARLGCLSVRLSESCAMCSSAMVRSTKSVSLSTERRRFPRALPLFTLPTTRTRRRRRMRRREWRSISGPSASISVSRSARTLRRPERTSDADSMAMDAEADEAMEADMAAVDAEEAVRMAAEEEAEDRTGMAAAGDRGMGVMAAINIARGVVAARAVGHRGAVASPSRTRKAEARRGEEWREVRRQKAEIDCSKMI